MYTHIHTTEWMHSQENSTTKQNYFINRINGDIIAELQTKGGFEYYKCTNDQMQSCSVGIYLGCVKSNETDPIKANIMVYNHDSQAERTVSVNDEQYLD